MQFWCWYCAQPQEDLQCMLGFLWSNLQDSGRIRFSVFAIRWLQYLLLQRRDSEYALGCFDADGVMDDSFLIRGLFFSHYVPSTDSDVFDYVSQSRCPATMIGMVGTQGCTWVVSPLAQGQRTLKTFSADMGG